ncbi:hypothetical protein B9Z34_00030 [Limnohabitans sp. Hippo3]|nr:hypothetical protein B9Z34_00030 [Limnohabitans sp. Hippo3]
MALKSLEARFLIWSVDSLEMAVALNELMIDMVAPRLSRGSAGVRWSMPAGRGLLVQIQNRTGQEFL